MNTAHWDEKMLGPRLGASRMAKQLLSTVARVAEIQMHLRCMCFAHVVLVLVLVFLFLCFCVLVPVLLVAVVFVLVLVVFLLPGFSFVSSNTRKSVGKRTNMASECHISTNGSGWRCKILGIPLRKNPFPNGFLRKKTTKLNQKIALEQIFHTYQTYDIVDWQQLLLSGSFESDQIYLSFSPFQALGGLKFWGPGEITEERTGELALTNTPKSAVLKWPANRWTSSQFTMLGYKNSHVVSPKSAENLDVNLGFAVAGQGLQHIDTKDWWSTVKIKGKRLLVSLTRSGRFVVGSGR